MSGAKTIKVAARVEKLTLEAHPVQYQQMRGHWR